MVIWLGEGQEQGVREEEGELRAMVCESEEACEEVKLAYPCL